MKIPALRSAALAVAVAGLAQAQPVLLPPNTAAGMASSVVSPLADTNSIVQTATNSLRGAWSGAYNRKALGGAPDEPESLQDVGQFNLQMVQDRDGLVVEARVPFRTLGGRGMLTTDRFAAWLTEAGADGGWFMSGAYNPDKKTIKGEIRGFGGQRVYEGTFFLKALETVPEQP